MLILAVFVNQDNSFQVYRSLREHSLELADAVLKLDYKYTPWPRKGGNLLWS